MEENKTILLKPWYAHYDKDSVDNIIEENKIDIYTGIFTAKSNLKELIFNEISTIEELDMFFRFCNGKIPGIEWQLREKLRQFKESNIVVQEEILQENKVKQEKEECAIDEDIQESIHLKKISEEINQKFKHIVEEYLEAISRRTQRTNSLLSKLQDVKIPKNVTEEKFQELIQKIENIDEKINNLQILKIDSSRKEKTRVLQLLIVILSLIILLLVL